MTRLGENKSKRFCYVVAKQKRTVKEIAYYIRYCCG